MYYNGTPQAFQAVDQYIAINLRNPTTDALIATVYKTDGTSPLSLAGMTAHSADISAYAGQTVRLDVEANVQRWYLPAAFDNFRVE
jgi:hypothetical protein